MAEQQQRQCLKDHHHYDQQRAEHAFSSLLDNSIYDEERWRTSTQDAFSIPELEKIHAVGSRRDLLRNTLNKSIVENLENDMEPEQVDDSIPLSEYNDNFCDPKFTPFMDKLDTSVDKLIDAFPLYVCNNRTLYKELVERGTLKLRSEISNLNEPFRRNCTFTTSPDCALREPTGGF